MDKLAHMRRDYRAGSLGKDDLLDQWWHQLGRWVDEADKAGIYEANAMVLATANQDGLPSARTVLLKHLDERGLVWFSNSNSRKGQELAGNPQASVCFSWPSLERQITAHGAVTLLADEEIDAYWDKRPRPSQLAAWVGRQSAVVDSRQEIEYDLEEIRARFPDEVARPDWWLGYRLAPSEVEFWQGGPARLHDRIRLRETTPGIWIKERLGP